MSDLLERLATAVLVQAGSAVCASTWDFPRSTVAGMYIEAADVVFVKCRGDDAETERWKEDKGQHAAVEDRDP